MTHALRILLRQCSFVVRLGNENHGPRTAQKFREPLSIFTKYKTTVTPKMFIFGVTVVLYFVRTARLNTFNSRFPVEMTTQRTQINIAM